MAESAVKVRTIHFLTRCVDRQIDGKSIGRFAACLWCVDEEKIELNVPVIVSEYLPIERR